LYATIKNWVTQIKCGDFSTSAYRRGRSKTVTTPEIIDKNHDLSERVASMIHRL
jgi:hypothetical protein